MKCDCGHEFEPKIEYRHRLICGDCTDKAVVDRVMGGERAALIITDPPYNFHYGGAGVSTQKFKDALAPLTNYDPQDLIEILSGLNWGGVFIFCNKELLPDYFGYAKEKGGSFNLLTWCKTRTPPFTNNTLLPDIEYCVYIEGEGREFVNGLDVSMYSRWYSGDNKDEGDLDHPTIKPLGFIERLAAINSMKDSIVVDFYLGSGTTLIACERLGRKCRAIEISPAYCAVAIQRWVDMTGGTPELITS